MCGGRGFISYSPCYLHVLWSCVSLCGIAGNELLDLPKDAVGRTILFNGVLYKIIDLNKFPIVLEKISDGKKICITENAARVCLTNSNIKKEVVESNKKEVTKPKSSENGGLVLRPNPIELEQAKNEGINFNDELNLIIMSKQQFTSEVLGKDTIFKKHPLNKPIREYSNGMLKMQITTILKKYPFGSVVINTNIDSKLLVK